MNLSEKKKLSSVKSKFGFFVLEMYNVCLRKEKEDETKNLIFSSLKMLQQ